MDEECDVLEGRREWTIDVTSYGEFDSHQPH